MVLYSRLKQKTGSVIMLSKYLCGLIAVIASSTAIANSSLTPITAQDYYDEASYLISNFRKCSLIDGQQSATVKGCIEDAALQFRKARLELIKNNPAYVKEISRFQGNAITSNKGAELAKLNCEKLYPDALKKNFTNQISSCKGQVDMNMYLKVGAALVKMGE